MKGEVWPLEISIAEGGKAPAEPTRNGEIACDREGENMGAMLKQWLACLFLGAVNIEQTKYLS